MAPKIKLKRTPDEVVVVTEDYSGYLGGRCIVCCEEGWLDPRHGYPHRVKEKVSGNRLIHTAKCPMNDILKKDGSLRKRKKRTKKHPETAV